MKIRVYESQKAAIRAGQEPRSGHVYVDVDVASLTPEEREELIRTGQDGVVGGQYNSGQTFGLNGLATTDNVRQWLWAARAKRLAQEAENEAGYEALVVGLLACSQEEFNAYHFSSFDTNEERAKKDARLAERLTSRKITEEAANQQKMEAARQAVADERAHNEAREVTKLVNAEARRQQITTWVAEHGTPNQQERFAAGLLAEQEILDSMHEQVFGKLSDLGRYEKIVCADIECTDECYEKRCKYESYVPDNVGAEDWDSYRVLETRVRGVYPIAELEIREHRGWCDNCEAETTRLAVKVSTTVGVMNFTQEFAL